MCSTLNELVACFQHYLNADRGLLSRFKGFAPLFKEKIYIFERGRIAIKGFKRLQSKQKQMVGKFSTSNHSFQLQGMLKTSLKEPCFKLIIKYHFFTKVHLKLKDMSNPEDNLTAENITSKHVMFRNDNKLVCQLTYAYVWRLAKPNVVVSSSKSGIFFKQTHAVFFLHSHECLCHVHS